jgi:hypothetical protein
MVLERMPEGDGKERRTMAKSEGMESKQEPTRDIINMKVSEALLLGYVKFTDLGTELIDARMAQLKKELGIE